MSTDFESLYKEFHPKILRYVSRMTSPEEAEDITQEVFLKASRSLGGFKGEASLSTWIYRIATNAALDRLRATARTPLNPITETELEAMDRNVWSDEPTPAADDELVRTEMNDCIREFIERLPPDYMTVMRLSRIEGMKNTEIAEVLGISLDTVKIRLHRGRARLKKELQEGCVFYHDSERGLSCDRKPTPTPGPIPLKFRKPE